MDGSIERLVMPALIADNRLVLGFPSDAYWMDVGTPERYIQVHNDLLAGRLPGWAPDDIAHEALLGRRLPRSGKTPLSLHRPCSAPVAASAARRASPAPASSATTSPSESAP